jgi:hypothetical protein
VLHILAIYLFQPFAIYFGVESTGWVVTLGISTLSAASALKLLGMITLLLQFSVACWYGSISESRDELATHSWAPYSHDPVLNNMVDSL